MTSRQDKDLSLPPRRGNPRKRGIWTKQMEEQLLAAWDYVGAADIAAGFSLLYKRPFTANSITGKYHRLVKLRAAANCSEEDKRS